MDVEAKRGDPPLKTQCRQNLVENGKWIVLTLSLLCYMRDAAWSWNKYKASAL